MAQQAHPDDLIGIATAHPNLGLELVTPFTTAHASVIAALNRVHTTDAAGLLDDLPDLEDADLAQIMAGGLVDRLEGQVQAYAEQLTALADTMRAVEGRKHVLLFSQGFADVMITDRATVRAAIADMGREFQAADALIHVLDPLGMRTFDTGPDHATSPFEGGGASSGSLRDGHQSLLSFAEATGGTVTWNTNDLRAGSAAIVEDTATYYVVGYRRLQSDPEVVDLEIGTTREGVEIVSGPRRMSPPPAYETMTSAQRQLQLADVLAGDTDQPGIEFDVVPSAFPALQGPGRIAVAVSVSRDEIRQLERLRPDRRVEIETIVFLKNGNQQTVGVTRAAAGVESAKDLADVDRVVLLGYIAADPGACTLRVAVRERTIGFLSAKTAPCHVPDIGAGPTILQPLLLGGAGALVIADSDSSSDHLDLAGEHLAPLLGDVTPGDWLRVLITAYGGDAVRLEEWLRTPGSLVLVDRTGRTVPLQGVEVIDADSEPGENARLRFALRVRLPQYLAAAQMRIRLSDAAPYPVLADTAPRWFVVRRP